MLQSLIAKLDPTNAGSIEDICEQQGKISVVCHGEMIGVSLTEMERKVLDEAMPSIREKLDVDGFLKRHWLDTELRRSERDMRYREMGLTEQDNPLSP